MAPYTPSGGYDSRVKCDCVVLLLTVGMRRADAAEGDAAALGSTT
jgi:hypothetical protein